MIGSKNGVFYMKCDNCGYESKIVANNLDDLRERTKKYKWVKTERFDICADCAAFPHEMKKKIRKEFEAIKAVK